MAADTVLAVPTVVAHYFSRLFHRIGNVGGAESANRSAERWLSGEAPREGVGRNRAGARFSSRLANRMSRSKGESLASGRSTTTAATTTTTAATTNPPLPSPAVTSRPPGAKIL